MNTALRVWTVCAMLGCAVAVHFGFFHWGWGKPDTAMWAWGEIIDLTSGSGLTEWELDAIDRALTGPERVSRPFPVLKGYARGLSDEQMFGTQATLKGAFTPEKAFLVVRGIHFRFGRAYIPILVAILFGIAAPGMGLIYAGRIALGRTSRAQRPNSEPPRDKAANAGH